MVSSDMKRTRRISISWWLIKRRLSLYGDFDKSVIASLISSAKVLGEDRLEVSGYLREDF